MILLCIIIRCATEPPAWRAWDAWSPCSKSCGEGSRSRARSCNKNHMCHDGSECGGDTTQTENCQDNTLGMYNYVVRAVG